MFLDKKISCWDFGLGECPLSKHKGFSFWQKFTFVGILIWVNMFACGVFVCGKSFFLWGFWLGWVSKHIEFMFLNKASSCWEFDLHMRFFFQAKAYFSGILIWVNLEAFGVSILGTSFILLGFWFGWVKSKQVNIESFHPSFLPMYILFV